MSGNPSVPDTAEGTPTKPKPRVVGVRKRGSGRAAGSQVAQPAQTTSLMPPKPPPLASAAGASPSGPISVASGSLESSNNTTTESSQSNTQATESSTLPKTTRKPASTTLQKFHSVMAMFGSKKGLTFPDFMEMLLNQETPLNDSERSMLSSWLQGSSRTGTRPPEIVSAMFLHRFSRHFQEGKLRHSTFSTLAPQPHSPLYLDKYPHQAVLLPPLSSPAELFSAREGLEELFVRATMAIVDYEAELLCAPKDGLPRGADVTWDIFDSYSLEKEQAKVQATAPVSWAIASTLAFNRDLDTPPGNTEVSAIPHEAQSHNDTAESTEPPLENKSERTRNPALVSSSSECAMQCTYLIHRACSCPSSCS
jgi:hypothetical protein